MKSEDKESARTSRRGFAKQAASALVAVPALAAMSSCKPDQSSKQSQNNIGPCPSPTPTSNSFKSNGDPPVIIDGGSVKIDSKGEFGPVEGKQGGYSRKFPDRYDYISGLQVEFTNNDGIVVNSYQNPNDFSKDSILKIWVQYADDDDANWDTRVLEFTFESNKDHAGLLSYNNKVDHKKFANQKRPERLLLPRNEGGPGVPGKKSVRPHSWEVSSATTGFHKQGGLDDPPGYDTMRILVWFDNKA
jgi:hypothetical protein